MEKFILLLYNSKNIVYEYKNLLSTEETNIPNNVSLTIQFFKKRNIWFKLARNRGFSEVNSCSEAAHNRSRLGSFGIPLRDELKSLFVKINNSNIFFMLHCRANRNFSFEKIEILLKNKGFFNSFNNIDTSNLCKIDGDELNNKFDMEYGLVNPFCIEEKLEDCSKIFHIFDTSLTENFIPPYTMMTNAGSKSWSVEFSPIEITKLFNNSLTENVTTNYTESKKLSIGILTGNGPESGMFLWELINRIIRNKLSDKCQGDIDLPEVKVESDPDMGLSMELEEREFLTKKAVEKGISSLCKRGAEIITIACNTTQYFKSDIEKICHKYNVRFVSMEEPLIAYIEKNNIENFSFLGIKYTIDKHFSGFKKIFKHQVEFITEKALNEMSKLGFLIKKEGISSKSINQLRNIINQNTNCDIVVIALTEITILMDSQKKKSIHGKKYIDTLKLLAEYIADIYLNSLYPRDQCYC